MELPPDSDGFELPQSVLSTYPELNDLSSLDLQHIALYVYYYNRSIQELLNTLSQGRSIRGLTSTWAESILADIRDNLSKLTTSQDALLLTSFIDQEQVLLLENISRWSDQTES